MAVEDHTAPVEYREVPGAIGYRVGGDCSVWSRRRRGPSGKLGDGWRLLVQSTTSDGYKVVTIRIDGAKGCRSVAVHTLMLTAFVGPRPDGMECRHLDGNPANNRLDNLRWGTSAENNADRARHGTLPTRGTHARSKLSQSQASEICHLYNAGGVNQTELGRRFGVSQSAISYILVQEKRRAKGVGCVS